MSDNPSSDGAHFAVVQNDEAGMRNLGEIALDERGMITVAKAAPLDTNPLPGIARELNERPHINVKAPPGPGAPRFALASRKVERGTAEFLPALRDYLEKYYDIELRAK